MKICKDENFAPPIYISLRNTKIQAPLTEPKTTTTIDDDDDSDNYYVKNMMSGKVVNIMLILYDFKNILGGNSDATL